MSIAIMPELEDVLDDDAVDEVPTVLIVDDSPLFTFLARDLIKVGARLPVRTAVNGKEALASVAEIPPAIVVSDLRMPEMDGLELVAAMKEKYPTIPVIIMTSEGSEALAVKALQAGAASYVPKHNLKRDLAQTVVSVLAAAKQDRRKQTLLRTLARRESDFVLVNDPAIVPLLVAHLQEELAGMGVCGPSERTRVGVALEEALLNALYHGNLGVSSSLKEDGGNAFHDLARRRRNEEPYASRRVRVTSRVTHGCATYVIRDEGAGFDVSALPDPTDPAFYDRPSGRGLLLMRAFMHDIRYNETGNELTMVKKRS